MRNVRIESTNIAAMTEKPLAVMNSAFETGWSGWKSIFVVNVMTKSASRIPKQHAMMLKIKTGLRRAEGVVKTKSVMMRGTSTEARGGTMRRTVTNGRMTSVQLGGLGEDILLR